jgi:hypothetical protein
MVSVKTKKLSYEEKFFYQKFVNKNKQHGVLISSIDKDCVNISVMTSQEIPGRDSLNQVRLILSDSTISYIACYKISIIEFLKLITDAYYHSNIIFLDKEMVKDAISALPNKSLKVCHLDKNLYDNCKHQLVCLDKSKNKNVIVQNYLKSKG